MREIEREEVDKVDKEDDLGHKEVPADEKVAPEEVEDVVNGEMWSDHRQNVCLVAGRHVCVEKRLHNKEELQEKRHNAVKHYYDLRGGERGEVRLAKVAQGEIVENTNH